MPSFTRVTLIVDDAARALDKATEKTRPARMKILDQAVKMQALLATKLRLTTQARVDPKALSRKQNNHTPSFYDTMSAELPDDWR